MTLRVTCVTANNGFPRSIMICLIFNVEVLASSEERVWEGTLRVTCVTANNGFHRSIMFHNVGGTWTSCFSSTWRGPWVGPDNGLPRSIMIWVWIWLVQLGTFGLLNNFPPLVVEQLLNPISFIQSCFKEIFG